MNTGETAHAAAAPGDAVPGGGLSGDRKRLLNLIRARKGLAEGAEIQPRRAACEPVVLSFNQDKLWSSMRHAPGHAVWRMCQAIGLHGELDVGALQAALDALVDRHEVLRTRYVLSEHAADPVIEPPSAFPLSAAEPIGTAGRESGALLEELVSEETREPFHPGTAPVIRARLLRLSHTEHLLLVAAHRMAYDGWSRGVLLAELGALYSPGRDRAARPLALPDLQYSDFARWQRRHFSGQTLEDGVRYWTRQLAGAPTVLDLQTDQPRPPERTYAGEGLPVLIDAALNAELGRLARSQGMTVFMVLHAAWAVLLASLTGEHDIVVGTPVANRRRTEFESLIGYFANVVALRTRLDGDMTVRELLGQVRQMVLADHPHQGVPFAAVAEAMSGAAGSWDSPAYRVMINLVNAPLGTVEAPGLTLTPLVTAPRATEYELSLIFAERGGTVAGGLVYASELFARPTIAKWIDRYLAILRQVVRSPDGRLSGLLTTSHLSGKTDTPREIYVKDLTQGRIASHVAKMAVPIAIGLLFQTLYYLVDLYFIAPLGGPAIAGVGAAGNVTFLVLALTQVLGVGTMVLVSHAAGRKDGQAVRAVFNQALVLSAAGCAALLLLGYATIGSYMETISADPAAVHLGVTYMHWFLPSLALQFPLAAMSSALRGIGVMRPAVVVQLFSVLLNALLAPVLIAGRLTGYKMGVAGAGLASSLSVAAALVALWFYSQRSESDVAVNRVLWRPQLGMWRRMLSLGLPSGGEYAILFVNSALVYWAIRRLGTTAQAGFGAGSRIMNAVLLPAIAIAFAAGPIAGQNFGAARAERVRRTFVAAALMSTFVMVLLTVLVQLRPDTLMRPFTHDAAVVSAGGLFLQLLSWNFVAQGLIFTCSSIFQGLGNTWPALVSSAGRLLLFAAVLIWLSSRPGFTLEQVWYLSVATVTLQALASLALLRAEFRRRLGSSAATRFAAPLSPAQAPAPADEA